MKSPDKLLANILIVNNLINVAIITLSAYFTWSSFGKSAYVFFVLTFVVTAVIIFCGEIIPKVYASKNKKLFIKTSSLVLIPSNVIFKPLILMLIKISQAFKNNKRELLESSKEELNKAMSLTIDKSTSKEEKDILLFGKWSGLAVSAQIPNIGAAVPIFFQGTPLFIIRTKKNKVKVFQNTCRHRGMILIDRVKSIEGAIRCPYHSWCYSTEGSLISTPHVGGGR